MDSVQTHPRQARRWLATILGAGLLAALASTCTPAPAPTPRTVSIEPVSSAPLLEDEDEDEAESLARPDEREPIVLALVLDRSGSMTGLRLEMALAACQAAVDELAKLDQLTVIAFDSNPNVIVPLQRVTAPEAIREQIGRIQAGGGTEIFTALDKVYEVLTPSGRHHKHVVLLTDGQSSRRGIVDLVRLMRHGGITITTIGLGDSLDREMLEQIADLGGGRYHEVDQPEALPEILRQEVKRATGPPKEPTTP